jgi:hypothetical protein
VTIQKDKAPIRIDVDATKPFSRYGIPWDDENVVGLDTVWLKQTGSTRIPTYALVISEYTECKGLLCLVREDGSVAAGFGAVGIIQRVRPANIAPGGNPQMLVYSNSGHGTGSVMGELVLLEYVGGAFRELLRVPRYEYNTGVVHEAILALPITTQGNLHGPRIIVPIVRVAENEAGGMEASWASEEYEWDGGLRLFRRSAQRTTADMLTQDGWTWLSSYDYSTTGQEQAATRDEPPKEQ